MNKQITKAVFFLHVFLVGSTLILPAQSCPEVLTCSNVRNFPVKYCLSGTNQTVIICDAMPFDNPRTINNNTYILNKHPSDLPICVEFEDDAPSDVDFRSVGSEPVEIFRANKLMADVNRIVEEINCVCTEETANVPDPESELALKTKCCFRFNFSEDPYDFIDAEHPTGDRNTAGISTTYAGSNCELLCPDYLGFPTISINNTVGFLNSEAGSPKVYFYNGDILPKSSTGSLSAPGYEAYSLMLVLQHEVLHAMGFKWHLDYDGPGACPNPRARGSVHNTSANFNEDRRKLSNDEKCMIRGVYCPFLETTLGVREHRKEDEQSLTTIENGIVWQELLRSETSPIVDARVTDYLGRTFETKLDIIIDRENHRIGIKFETGYNSPVFLVLIHANGIRTYQAFGTSSR